jgi:hypothetical protein
MSQDLLHGKISDRSKMMTGSLIDFDQKVMGAWD